MFDIIQTITKLALNALNNIIMRSVEWVSDNAVNISALILRKHNIKSINC